MNDQNVIVETHNEFSIRLKDLILKVMEFVIEFASDKDVIEF